MALHSEVHNLVSASAQPLPAMSRLSIFQDIGALLTTADMCRRIGKKIEQRDPAEATQSSLKHFFTTHAAHNFQLTDLDRNVAASGFI